MSLGFLEDLAHFADPRAKVLENYLPANNDGRVGGSVAFQPELDREVE